MYLKTTETWSTIRSVSMKSKGLTLPLNNYFAREEVEVGVMASLMLHAQFLYQLFPTHCQQIQSSLPIQLFQIHQLHELPCWLMASRIPTPNPWTANLVMLGLSILFSRNYILKTEQDKKF